MNNKFYRAIDKTFNVLMFCEMIRTHNFYDEKEKGLTYEDIKEKFAEERKNFGDAVTKLYVLNTVTINSDGILQLSSDFYRYFFDCINDKDTFGYLMDKYICDLDDIEGYKSGIVDELVRWYTTDYTTKIHGSDDFFEDVAGELVQLAAIASNIWRLNGKQFDIPIVEK